MIIPPGINENKRNVKLKPTNGLQFSIYFN